ncbi:MAG TPA: DUF3108 domain-containing protein [Myxococcota bacterium]|nr:DUF3108 domain-containing protein [Myxococcota bacterium]
MIRPAVLVLCCLAGAAAEAAPSHVSAEYRLESKGMTIGHVSETFERRGDTYAIRSESRSEGLLKVFYDERITLESRGEVGAGGLKPLRFEERRRRDPKRNVEATFDWANGVIHSRHRGEVKRVPLPQTTQDRISMMYQFLHVDPAAGPALYMSNGRKVERYSYRLVGEPRIATPAGEFETLHFERVSPDPGDSRVEVWLAKDRHNFPVRVVFDDPDGFRIEQSLVALQAR